MNKGIEDMKEFLKKMDLWIGNHVKLDDTLHFIAGMILSAFIAMLAMLWLGPSTQFGLICSIAFMGTVVVALAKEGIDTNIKNEDLERRDIFWTMMGSIMMIIIMVIFKNMDFFIDAYTRDAVMNSI